MGKLEDRVTKLEQRVTGQTEALYAIAVGIARAEPVAVPRIMACLDRVSGRLREKHHADAMIAEVEKVRKALAAALDYRPR
jgi:hypothetical protein